jgi:hypothetical protein
MEQNSGESPEDFSRRQTAQKAINMSALRARKKVIQEWGKACDAYIQKQKNAGSNVKVQTTEQIGLALLDRESHPNLFRVPQLIIPGLVKINHTMKQMLDVMRYEVSQLQLDS